MKGYDKHQMLFRHGNRLQQLSIMKCVKIFPGNLQLEVITKLLIMILIIDIISTISIIINSITTTDTRSYAAFRVADLDKIVGPGYSLDGYILGCFQWHASCLRHSGWIGPDLLCYCHLSWKKLADDET